MTVELPLFPGATLGVLGGGQLGRMFAIEAMRMGYQVWVLDPDANSPAGAIANRHLQTSFEDPVALEELGSACAAITIEFENVPANSVRRLSELTRVTPSAECIEIAQDRAIEKNFAREAGLQTAPFGVINNKSDIDAVCESVGFPAILKTARLGYDGKGQSVCHDVDEVRAAFEDVDQVVCVLEKRIDLEREISVILSRDDEGNLEFFPIAENRHSNGILDITIVPSSISNRQQEQAHDIAGKLASSMGYVGILAVEMFIDRDGALLINEVAPRPHNSGHYTLDACITSQFEQQVRMLCGLGSGDLTLIRSVAMLNLLGDRWFPEGPNWHLLYQYPHANLHLYGKHEARPGRKMGHINVLSDQISTALSTVESLKTSL